MQVQIQSSRCGHFLELHGWAVCGRFASVVSCQLSAWLWTSVKKGFGISFKSFKLCAGVTQFTLWINQWICESSNGSVILNSFMSSLSNSTVLLKCLHQVNVNVMSPMSRRVHVCKKGLLLPAKKYLSITMSSNTREKHRYGWTYVKITAPSQVNNLDHSPVSLRWTLFLSNRLQHQCFCLFSAWRFDI